MTDAERERFDALLEQALADLPPRITDLLQDTPLIVEDRPDDALLATIAREHNVEPTEELAAELCGLYSGAMLTEQSVDASPELPPDIRLFREGIINLAGGWDQDGAGKEADDIIYEEIVITLLHEIGHHFGLEEEDLEELGYE